MVTVTDTGIAIDSYPYTFSPLLLFAQEHYFDKGHSNYNSVAQFFSQVVRVDMLDNVLYERKNMLYDELLDYVTKRRMLVTCCIDSHFTGFQIIGDHSCVYYDPLKPGLSCISGAQSYTKFVAFLLLKCNYGDNQHLVDNKSFYTGPDANATRRTICARAGRSIQTRARCIARMYVAACTHDTHWAIGCASLFADKLWRDINKTELSGLFDVKSKALSLNLDTYLLVNNSRNPRMMSTQVRPGFLSHASPRARARPRFALSLYRSGVVASRHSRRAAPATSRHTSLACCARWAKSASHLTAPHSTCQARLSSPTLPSTCPTSSSNSLLTTRATPTQR